MIQPEAALAHSRGPHYTAADVERYIAAILPPGTVKGTPAPSVVSITFETASQVAIAYQESLLSGSAASSPVYVVIVSGIFKNDYSVLPPVQSAEA